MRIVLFANGGEGCASVLKPAMIAIRKKHHFINMFPGEDGCADHFVCKWGGCASPPNPPRSGKDARIILFANDGGFAPQSPAVLRPPMYSERFK